MSIFKLWSDKSTDHESFEVLVKPHINQLYALAHRLTGQSVDAEDLVQDVVLKLYPRLTELQKVDKLGPWLARVLYRHFIDKQRSRNGSPVEYTSDELLLESESNEQSVEPMLFLEKQITQQVLQDALDQLNEDQRLVLMLHDVEGYTLEEIHYMQSVPVGTLKSRLHRGQNKLRTILSQMERFDDAIRVTG